MLLTDDEKRVIDLVVNTFGMYGGKVLEKITHNEDPWIEARKGYGDRIPSSELLPKDRIMKYYIAGKSEIWYRYRSRIADIYPRYAR